MKDVGARQHSGGGHLAEAPGAGSTTGDARPLLWMPDALARLSRVPGAERVAVRVKVAGEARARGLTSIDSKLLIEVMGSGSIAAENRR